MIQVWIIDENGFYQNESKFVEEVLENMTTVPLLIGYIKPKFNGEEWVEGATEEEIKVWEDSQQIDISLSDKVQLLRTDLEAYKHTYIEFIEYGGHQQRTLSDDIIKIQGSERLLREGAVTQVNWKYPDERVVITDANYFWYMQLAISDATNKSYNAEDVLIQEINALTEETVDSYDMKARFDTVFKSM